MRIAYSSDVEVIRPLAEKWAGQCNGPKFGIEIRPNEILSDLDSSLSNVTSTLILVYDGVELTGFLALFAVQSLLGGQLIALIRYWYAVPNYKRAGVAMFRAAQEWGMANGCSHLMVGASNLASQSHDNICRFCERMGMELVESAYLQELKRGGDSGN